MEILETNGRFRGYADVFNSARVGEPNGMGEMLFPLSFLSLLMSSL